MNPVDAISLACASVSNQRRNQMTIKSKIYVGVRESGEFVRNHEENDEELVYQIFTSARKPTRKTHMYGLVVGPFPNKASAIVFRDVEGVNTVEDAVRGASSR